MSFGARIPVVARRFGVKGPRAPAWLEQHGFTVPNSPNRIARWSHDGGGRCLRLGHGEFLVETDGVTAAPVTADDVWLLLRSDLSLLLDDPSWPRRLAQVCSFDFQRFVAEPGLVAMTLLAGISVTLAHEPPTANDSQPALRLWCDATHATYLQHCLRHLGESP